MDVEVSEEVAEVCDPDSDDVVVKLSLTVEFASLSEAEISPEAENNGIRRNNRSIALGGILKSYLAFWKCHQIYTSQQSY